MRTLLRTAFTLSVIIGMCALWGLANQVVDAYPGFVAGVAFAVIFGGLIWGLVYAGKEYNR
jgi:hypothetical protein